ncbi:hypothetical protein C8T65DRAFT_745204 [Cerioporus squamosus]|nr:hypothetical protein C8T65DRAFT_745204 [Cerioporus squamosus]
MATIFTPAPPPPTRLGRYRQLAPLAGVHVSPICLGGMSIGDQWAKFGAGAMDKGLELRAARRDGSSEAFIGEWMETRGIRDQMVVATKYSANSMRGRDDVGQKVTYVGNSIKSMIYQGDWSILRLKPACRALQPV